MQYRNLHTLSYQCLLELSTTEGINASSQNEAYGCIFGRDSAITICKLLTAHAKKPNPHLLEICKRTLLTLVGLQGKQHNLESGEEPGKFIHEFRKDNYERLINRPRPWFVYDNGQLRNYDSIDSTPLSLIAIYKYWKLTHDNEFLLTVLSSVEEGLNWIITYGDKDKDLFLEYELPHERKHGGLVVQSWTDSRESLQKKDGSFPKYPIAAVEVQAFAWLALRLWSDFYKSHYPPFGQKLFAQAEKMKKKFNKEFVFKDKGLFYAAQAIDGQKQQIRTITANPLLCLWATYQQHGKNESILNDDVVPQMVQRAFQEDLFEKDAGIRTMSISSPTFDPTETSYHNGSFWPMLNGLIHEGLVQWEFNEKAEELKQATLKPIQYFNCPIELFIKTEDGKYIEYKSRSGKNGCKYQAWTAAALFDLTLL